MFEIINTLREFPIDIESFKDFIAVALEVVPEAAGQSVSIVFVSDEKMIELNSMFRNKTHTTDVLSFPNDLEDFENIDNSMGEVLISIDQAKKQASQNELTLETEIKQLALHGILHLLGYDHESDSGEMNSLELELRDKLGINN